MQFGDLTADVLNNCSLKYIGMGIKLFQSGIVLLCYICRDTREEFPSAEVSKFRSSQVPKIPSSWNFKFPSSRNLKFPEFQITIFFKTT